MANRFYELTVAGCKRSLPILNVTDKLAIAGFIMLGDPDLTLACAKDLAKKIPADTDVILTAETKGIPLAADLARELGMERYVVARKSVKAYMENAVWVEDVSITTKGVQKLCRSLMQNKFSYQKPLPHCRRNRNGGVFYPF